MITGLIHAHRGLGYLILLSTSISVLVALAGALIGPSPRLVKLAGVLARGVELPVGGLLFLLGLGLWIGRWPVSIGYGWIGVVAVALQGVLVARAIKPNLAALARGEGSRGAWAGYAVAHLALMVFVWIAMTNRW